MSVICPTVMGKDAKEYRKAIQRISDFATRIHIDFADGVFAPTKLEPIADAWWLPGMIVDFHVMYQKPMEHIEEIIQLQPSLAIIHAEADNAKEFVNELDGLGIDIGVALLRDTGVDKIINYIDRLDHVLIFSGDLGYYGGKADLTLLNKVKEIKALKPDTEIGWDGGVNEDTLPALINGGVDVLNVGGAIQKAVDPAKAYAILEELTA